MKKEYIAPLIEIIMCQVEDGFAVSEDLDGQLIDLIEGDDIEVIFS